MSLNSEDSKGGSGGAHGAPQAPRLTPGGYPAWHDDVHVFLQRAGAEGVHTKPMTEAKWAQWVTGVAAWQAEVEADADAALFGAPLSPQGTSASTSKATASVTQGAPWVSVSKEVKAQRDVVIAYVARSQRVYGVLYGALPAELRTQVSHLAQGWAYGLWSWLERKFQSTEEDAVDVLLTQWSALRMSDDESFDAYRARVSKLASLLKQAKEEPSPRVFSHTLLSKLQPRFKQAVLALKASGKLANAAAIDWEWVTAFINNHERDEARLEAEAGAGADARAMAAQQLHKHGSWASKTGAATQSSSAAAHTSGGSSGGGGYAPGSGGGSGGGDRSRSQFHGSCYTCGVYGHSQRFCPNKGKKASGGFGGGGGGGGSGGAGRPPSPARAPHQAQALMQMSANPFQVLSSTETDSSAGVRKEVAFAAVSVVHVEEAQRPTQGMRTRRGGKKHKAQQVASMAAKAASSSPVFVTKTSQSVAKEVSKHTWGVDTMASLHVSGNRGLFSSLRKCDPLSVLTADGGTVKVTQKGTVHIRVATATGEDIRGVIEDVFFHEKFATNLLSWNVLREKGWELHSMRGETFMLTPCRTKIELRTLGRVSVMHAKVGAPLTDARVFSLDAPPSAEVEELVRWHERLGHMGFDRMVSVIKEGKTRGLGPLSKNDATLKQARQRVLDCTACALGKGSRTAFGHSGVDKGRAVAETLHMDTYHLTLKEGDREWIEYGLVVTDPFSEAHWFRRLKSKDETAGIVVEIVRIVQTQVGRKVKRLYADGGTEFINATLKAFCAAEGIELKYPPARTPQLNSVAERSVRTSKDMARTMLQACGLPDRFWHLAAAHATYVFNRTVVATATGVTPFESIYGRAPSAQHWGVFGCDAFYHIPKEQRSTLAAKMVPCVYLGHDSVQNAAKVYSLLTNKEVVTRDVRFRERAFTHAAALRGGDAEVIRSIVARGCDDAGHEAGPQGGLGASSNPETNEEWEVEKIIGRRGSDERVEYHVKWVGSAETTWEPARHFLGAQQLVSAFEEERAAQEGKHDLPEEPVAAAAAPVGAAPVKIPAAAASPAALTAVPVTVTVQRSSLRLRGFDPEPTASAHMAMSAMRSMQPDTFGDAEVACAVSAGAGLLDAQTPATYREAMAGPHAPKWRGATDAEFSSCTGLGAWEYVELKDLPKDTNILPCKWVFKIKTDENGNVTVWKARLTPKGFKQQYGKDYFEVYAATGMYKVMRAHLSLVAKLDHELEQLDVPTAFLNADVEEHIYMEVPEGYREGREGQVCKLKKALYGLKQAPRNWYLLVSKFIKETMGYKACVSDPCLFHRRSQSGRLMLLFLFVDDFQVSFHEEDRAEWNKLKALLVDRFNTKDMGESRWILGMRIQRDRKASTITLDQELYVTKALERYGLTECKVASTPEVGRSYARGGAKKNVEPSEGEVQSEAALNAPADRMRYMELTGTLMYAAVATRLDIAHATNQLASHMLAPTRRNMLAAEQVLRYLAGTRDVALIFGAHNGSRAADSRGHARHLKVDVCAFADADWANGKGDRRSITGWVGKLNGDVISWASKKQRTVALSTCEAELYAEAAAIQEVLWLRGLLGELGLQTEVGSLVYGDNQSAIAVSQNGIKGERTKHVDVKYHFVTETVERGDVVLKWVPTSEQQADIFTKGLERPAFELFRQQLMTR